MTGLRLSLPLRRSYPGFAPGRLVVGTLAGLPLLWLVLFLVVPLALMTAFSVRPDLRGGLLDPFVPTLRHYGTFVSSAAYARVLGISIATAAGVAAATVVLAYPLAYFLARHAGARAGLLTLVLLAPFWTSYLLRVMAWKLLLGQEGAINSFLLFTGVTDEPLPALLYNRGAVIVTLVYVWIPFAALPILAALARVRGELLDAAADLGADPRRQFLRVTLPLSMPGVLAAFFLVFIPTVGEYVTPLLVGGTSGTMYGNVVQDFFTKAANWPLGSALAVVMLGTTLVLVAVAVRVIDLRRLVE